jgi:hypothetical protein
MKSASVLKYVDATARIGPLSFLVPVNTRGAWCSCNTTPALSVLTAGPLYHREMAEIQDPAGPPVEGDGVNFTREQIEGVLAAACNFQGQGVAAREKCREDFRDAEREKDNTLRMEFMCQFMCHNLCVRRDRYF